MKRKIMELGLEENQEVENLNIISREIILLQKSEIILRGDKMKRTLLDDILQVYYSIPCEETENAYCSSCSCCKNKLLCNMITNLIYSMAEFY